MNEKTSILESNIEKHKRHVDLTSQVIQWKESHPEIHELEMVTLPAEQYGFERIITEQLKVSPFISKPTNVKFFCAETSEEIIVKGIKNMPQNCFVAHATIESLLSCRFDYQNKHNSYAAFRNFLTVSMDGKYRVNPHLIWADYCGQPSKLAISDSVRACLSKDNKNGLYYFTFDIGRVEKSKNFGNAAITAKVIEKYFRKILPKCTKITKIYSVQYIGGRRSTMATVGFMVGAGNVTPIISEYGESYKPLHRWKTENYSHMQWIQKNWNMGEPTNIRPFSKAKTTTTKADINNLSQIVAEAWEKSGKTSKSDKKAFCKAMSKKMGVSTQKIASRLAWHTNSVLIAMKKCA
jgi:hypothetical protein